jgi:heparosan-N-sulfate-glucuronate 5-epimerase
MASLPHESTNDHASDPSRGAHGRIGRGAVEVKRAFWSVVGGSIDFAPQPLGEHVEPAGLRGYYCDLRGKTEFSFDDMLGNGYDWAIPMAQAGLGYWERHLEGEPTAEEFFRFADWLMEHATPGIAGGLVWRADMPVAKYGLQPGWISAMAQGQAISVSLRAHALSGEERYLEAARAALSPLLTPVSEGGAQNSIDGIPVLEEYPTPTASAVLNGWIFALWGVHELANVAGDREARELFETSAAGLAELLPRYDAGWWSLYSLYDHGRPDLAKPFYQRLHPVMLEGLALITEDERLRAYARRWREQDTRTAIVRASADKIVFRVSRALR